MLVLGVDPGLAACGLALVRIEGTVRTLVTSVTVYTLPSVPFEERLDEIAVAALPLLKQAALLGLEEQGDAWHGNEERGDTNAAARKVQDVASVLRGLAIALGVPRRVMRPQTIRKLIGLSASTKGKEATGAIVRRLVDGVPPVKQISKHAIDGIAQAIAAEKEHHASSLVQGLLPGTAPQRSVRRSRRKRAA